MNPEYLAANDGSFESAGRGSGEQLERPRRRPDSTPYMQMTFAPLERRLDSAIFRSLFASSARQARPIRGSRRCSSQRQDCEQASYACRAGLMFLQMRYPGYLLNPGDMYQVEPEKVMFATGATKAAKAIENQDDTEGKAEANAESAETSKAQEPAEEEDDREPRDVLKDLLRQAKSILTSPREGLSAKRKQDLRGFSKQIKRTLSKSKSGTILTDSLEAQFLELQEQLRLTRETKAAQSSGSPANDSSDSLPSTETTDSETSQPPSESISPEIESSTTITDSEYNSLLAALTTMSENPIDDDKPYATPWMPRDYMSAFAFIPRYLEVNPNICAGVYLRHPVARPGMAEVPTPYGESTGGSAFAWYLRRR